VKYGPWYTIYATVSFGLAAYLLSGHLFYASKLTNLALCHTLMWSHLALKMAASLRARPHTVAPGSDLDSLRVDVVVPIYNEDPALLAAGIRSMIRQTRLPRAVWLVDDGSRHGDQPFYILQDPVVVEAAADLEVAGVQVVKARQENRGKRHAQSVAFTRSDADIFVTVDSDTVLKDDAVEKLLIPFSRPATMSVGGTACGQNYQKSLFTRVLESGFVMSFIQGRMAEGSFGSVRVNCGILAAYRGDVVRDNMDRFLNQYFLHRPVTAGDDRALTLFAKERGRTEFQPEAVAYSALPVSVGHLVRQRLRWCRSFCWGTIWLLRRPITSADFWFTFTQVLALVMFGISMSSSVIGTFTGSTSPALLTESIYTATAIGLVSHFRYVLMARPGESVWQRMLTWWVSPLQTFLSLFILMPLYFVAIVTPRPQRTWGTRAKVEVGLYPVGAGGAVAAVHGYPEPAFVPVAEPAYAAYAPAPAEPAYDPGYDPAYAAYAPAPAEPAYAAYAPADYEYEQPKEAAEPAYAAYAPAANGYEYANGHDFVPAYAGYAAPATWYEHSNGHEYANGYQHANGHQHSNGYPYAAEYLLPDGQDQNGHSHQHDGQAHQGYAGYVIPVGVAS
jgi:cellulose synthase/poly-beta-1,6-N-acetylglucosamine synthase-like glycosyltransferase